MDEDRERETWELLQEGQLCKKGEKCVEEEKRWKVQEKVL